MSEDKNENAKATIAHTPLPDGLEMAEIDGATVHLNPLGKKDEWNDILVKPNATGKSFLIQQDDTKE